MSRMVCAALVLTLIAPVSGRPQEATARFDVATLKLSPPPEGASISITLGAFQNGRFTFKNVTLNDAVQFAFELPSKEQLVGLEWSDSVRLDVEGLAPVDTPQPRLRVMVRHLLEERVALKVRTEQRTLRHVALVVGGGGQKFSASTEAPAPGAVQLRGRIDHKRMPMGLLASLLSRFEQQLVVDRTGLAGTYAITLEWDPDTAVALVDLNAPPPDRPSLFAAVQEQLGLRLEGRRAPLDVVVIESASRTPADN